MPAQSEPPHTAGLDFQRIVRLQVIAALLADLRTNHAWSTTFKPLRDHQEFAVDRFGWIL